VAPKEAAARALNALQAAKHDNEAEDWMDMLKKHQGTGVSYYSAPNGALTYSAANLVR